MSNSFRVGSISASLNFDTGGFMQSIREAQGGATNLREGIKGIGIETLATTAIAGGMGAKLATMATTANFAIASTIARMVAMRSQAVATARELDKMNAAWNSRMNTGFVGEGTIMGGGGATDNEAKAVAALTTRYSGLISTAGKAALGIGAVGIAGALVARQLKPAIDASLELEHAFAFVRKTVDGTKDQLDQISDALRRMALEVPISAKELSGVAAAAGQLGIAREQIVDFTRVMAEMGIASDMTAEQAAVGFAQWANITGMAKADIDNLTSAVVYLGNNTATTESQILNMTLRLAGASRIVGVTDAEMAGLSASLASLGIWAESGGNAMSRVMLDMNTAVASGNEKLALFAATAGKTADQFANLFKSDPTQAIVDFIGGLAAAESAGQDVTAVLEALGVTEMESRRALLGLAGGHKDLARNIDGSTRAFAENNARATEANTLFGTGVSKVQLLKNATTELSAAVGDNLQSSYKGLIVTLTEAVNWTTNLIKTTDVLRNTIAATTAMFTGGVGRFLFGEATEAGAEHRIGRSHALAQESFGADKQSYMNDILGLTYKDAANSILSLQKNAKAATVDVSALNKELTNQKYKDDVLGLRDLVDSDVFKREAEKAIEIFRAVPDQVNAEMRGAKFADMWSSTRDGFKSVGEAAKLIPEEFRQEFIASAGVVEAELAKKGKSGGRKLADEAGKEFERAMEEAMRFRIELFPDEALAEEVRKVKTMAEQFPEIMSGDAVAKAFDQILATFEGRGVDAVTAIKTHILGIAPEFAAAMEDAVRRSAVAASEALMEARAADEDANHWSQRSDMMALGRDRLAGLTDPAGVATMLDTTEALREQLDELVRSGEMAAGQRDNILSLDYWENVRGLGSMSFEEITRVMQNFIERGEEVPEVLREAMKSIAREEWDKIAEGITNVGNGMQQLGAGKIGAAVSGFGRLLAIGKDIRATYSDLKDRMKALADAGGTTADLLKMGMTSVLGTIGLIIESVSLVIELFGIWGDEGKKELKGMAAVIDEIKEASEQWVDSLTDKLLDAIKTGQFAWRDFVNEVLDDLTRIAIRELVVSPLVNFGGDLLGFKSGGAFEKGHVVDSPEFFNTKSGPAVRGEAGTEVVMPAVRLRDGTLGVRSAGGESATINIYDYRRNDNSPVDVREGTGPDGRKFYDIIIGAVNKAVLEGDLDRALALGPMRRGIA
jgi:TP901 family phage tail tape measure protein